MRHKGIRMMKHLVRTNHFTMENFNSRQQGSAHRTPLWIFFSLILDLAKCKPNKPGRSNISKDEQKALRELANNSSIVIKPADKGGAVVIQDRDSYIKEVL